MENYQYEKIVKIKALLEKAIVAMCDFERINISEMLLNNDTSDIYEVLKTYRNRYPYNIVCRLDFVSEDTFYKKGQVISDAVYLSLGNEYQPYFDFIEINKPFNPSREPILGGC